MAPSLRAAPPCSGAVTGTRPLRWRRTAHRAAVSRVSAASGGHGVDADRASTKAAQRAGGGAAGLRVLRYPNGEERIIRCVADRRAGKERAPRVQGRWAQKALFEKRPQLSCSALPTAS
jgi:hypothetical protein